MPRFTLPRRLLPLLLLGCALLAGCASGGTQAPEPTPSLDARIQQAASDMLEANPKLPRYSPMIAATFVNIDNLASTSTLGRISAELFASALSRGEVQVREVKMRDSLFIEQSLGELILSRQVQRLSQAHDARSVLIGTYAQGQDTLYLSVRVVRASDAMVLGSASLAMPLDNNLRAMLGEGW
ncbi:MAG: FlgO family outer membrane protein [Pseudomonadota bacterium]